MKENQRKAYFHLPGLFEFYEFYRNFLPIFHENREYFYDWCEIGSIYGAPLNCIWGGGRVELGESDAKEVLALVNGYGISARLTFSNSLLSKEHLSDRLCNNLCALFEKRNIQNPEKLQNGVDEQNAGTAKNNENTKDGKNKQNKVSLSNGVIVHSDTLAEYLKENYPHLILISSTTKVITDFSLFTNELNNETFRYVVPDFRLNKELDKMNSLSQSQKDKVEFLCNECCYYGCTQRKECYEAVSFKNLGIDSSFVCKNMENNEGYQFSKAMLNPGFISVEDIVNTYLEMGFTNYKIEGRGLGNALLLEFILYYMTKPKYQIHVREKMYLDNMLDLF